MVLDKDANISRLRFTQAGFRPASLVILASNVEQDTDFGRNGVLAARMTQQVLVKQGLESASMDLKVVPSKFKGNIMNKLKNSFNHQVR